MSFYDFTIETIKEAGVLLMKERKTKFLVSTKNNDHKNIVTSVDINIDNFIKKKINSTYPKHGIYSEESGTEGSGTYQWTIDPIDGTSNFSRAIPHFSISLGLLKNGIPFCGAVYNPITDELFSFKKDKGAFLNGEKIKVSDIKDIRNAHIFLHAGRGKIIHNWGGESYKKLLEHAKKTSNLACSSLDACFVASGRIEANIYGTLSLHDISPAVGILKEAGGVIRTVDNKKIDVLCKTQKIFMSNNKKIMSELITLIAQP